jgi:hypothetical protein
MSQGNGMKDILSLAGMTRPNFSGAQSAWFVNLNLIAEWVAHKKPLPGRWTSVFSRHAGRFQLGAQPGHIFVFESEMAISIRSCPLLFDGKMDVQTAGIEPDATAVAHRLRLGYLAQSEQTRIKRARQVLAALWHGDIDVGKTHGYLMVPNRKYATMRTQGSQLPTSRAGRFHVAREMTAMVRFKCQFAFLHNLTAAGKPVCFSHKKREKFKK